MTTSPNAEDHNIEPKEELRGPIWLGLSIVAVILSVGICLYSIVLLEITIPIITVICFVLFWLRPKIWDWVVSVLDKRPRSGWGNFSFTLTVATLLATTFEDLIDILVEVVEAMFLH